MTCGLSQNEFLVELLKVLTGDKDSFTCRMKNGGDSCDAALFLLIVFECED